MNGFFSYESKPMQIMMFIGDLILLNVIYLLCCLPIFTSGAAQAGLFTACKVLLDILLGSAKWLAFIAMGLCAIFQTLIPAFHSRFGCTWWQLIRNTWFLLFAHPLRSIATVAMFWIPAICFAYMQLYDFMALTPIWGSLYFATICCFATVFLKKPFNTLTEHFNEVHGIKPEGRTEALPEETEETEEAEEVPAE